MPKILAFIPPLVKIVDPQSTRSSPRPPCWPDKKAYKRHKNHNNHFESSRKTAAETHTFARGIDQTLRTSASKYDWACTIVTKFFILAQVSDITLTDWEHRANLGLRLSRK